MNKYFVILCLILFLSGLHAFPVTDGLLVHYNFNGTFEDDSGNDNHVTTNSGGTTINATSGMGGSGAAVFDGVDDRLYTNNMPFDASSGASTTASFWMNWAGKNSVMPIGFSTYDLWLTGGNFGFNSGGGDVTGISSSGLTNNWVYVTAVFYNGAPSPTTHKLYINGVKQNISLLQGSTSAHATTDYFYLGSWNHGGYLFQGSLDEVSLYNRALSDSEVTQLYNYYGEEDNFFATSNIPEPANLIIALIGLMFLLKHYRNN